MQHYEQEEDQDGNRATKPMSIQQSVLNKQGHVKKAFDFLITTPGKLRRGVARSGDVLRGFVEYNMKLFRSDDKKWALYLEWVDLDGEGHRLVLPHEVVAGVLQRANSIIAQCRSERAQRAALTRRQNKEVQRWEKGDEVHVTLDPTTGEERIS